MATAKHTAAHQPAAKKAAPKAATSKPATARSGTSKGAPSTPGKPAATKQPAAKPPSVKQAAAKRSAAAKPAAGKPAVTSAGTPTKKPGAVAKATGPATKPPTPKATQNHTMSTSKHPEPALEIPKPKFNKDGLGYTKDFDLSFVKEQFDALQTERVRLTGQALRLEAEAHALVEEAEMGDVKFDDEGGEGDTTSVERERDLALSAQAREAIEEIDAALVRISQGTYGYSVVSGRPIPKERLEAIPWSSVLVEEKVGGIGRR